MKPMLISRAGMMISKKPALPGCVRPCVPEIVFTSDGTLGKMSSWLFATGRVCFFESTHEGPSNSKCFVALVVV